MSWTCILKSKTKSRGVVLLTQPTVEVKGLAETIDISRVYGRTIRIGVEALTICLGTFGNAITNLTCGIDNWIFIRSSSTRKLTSDG